MTYRLCVSSVRHCLHSMVVVRMAPSGAPVWVCHRSTNPRIAVTLLSTVVKNINNESLLANLSETLAGALVLTLDE